MGTDKPIARTAQDHATDRKRFINVMIKHHTGNGVFYLITQGGGFTLKSYHSRSTGGATHISGATFGEVKSLSYDGPYRNISNVVEVLFIGLDDVGTKAKMLPMETTARVETSPGNFTDYVRFNPPATPDQADLILNSLMLAGYLDKACSQVDRVNRLPGSRPGKKEHTATLIRTDDAVEYDPAEFLKLVGVGAVARDKKTSTIGTPYPPGIEVFDVVLEWLEENGHVQGPDTEQFVYRVHCPWIHKHTDQTDMTGAKYFSCENRYQRGFMCHHTHGDSIVELLKWVVEQGGPDVGVSFTPDDRTGGPGNHDLSDLIDAGVGDTWNDTFVNHAMPTTGVMTWFYRKTVADAAMLHDVRMTAANNVSAQQPASPPNMEAVMTMCGATKRFNVMSQQIEYQFDDPAIDVLDTATKIGIIKSIASKCSIAPSPVDAALENIPADRYHPMEDWLRELPDWDGVDRIGEIQFPLDTPGEAYLQYVKTVTKKWLIQVVQGVC